MVPNTAPPAVPAAATGASRPPATARGTRLSRAAAFLMSSVALQRAAVGAAHTEREALRRQLRGCEGALDIDRHPTSQEGLVAAHAVDVLRVRLEGVEQRVTEAVAALRHLEQALDALHAPDAEAEATPADHRGLQSQRLFQIVEDERMRIARDVHDGPAQLLANLVLKAEIVERLYKTDPQTASAELADFKATARVALEDTRQLIFDLRPMTLDDLGLVPTMRKFLDDFQARSSLRCRFSLVGAERRLPRELEATLFRIIQEALTNVRRHARATTVDVSVNLQPHRATVSVKDDGRGFDVAEAEAWAQRTSHLGLVSMRERAGLENGVLDVISAPGRGTLVRVSVDY